MTKTKPKTKTGRVTAAKPRPCCRRPWVAGVPQVHLFTSHWKRTAPDGRVLEDHDICSWCMTRKRRA